MSFDKKCGPCLNRGYYGLDPEDECKVCGGKGKFSVPGTAFQGIRMITSTAIGAAVVGITVWITGALARRAWDSALSLSRRAQAMSRALLI